MIHFKNIGFNYGKTPVLQDVSLDIHPGECVAVLGASGSGKTTLLNILSGLLPMQAGIITNTHGLAPQTALVFQDYALFPNLSVLDNLKFVSKNEKEISGWITRLELQDHTSKKPSQLSGGQKQRVAVARALLCKPDLLLMDEPFSNLDTAHKNQLRLSLKSLLQKQQQSTILVTHDLEDAFALADRIAVLVNGNLVQCDTPNRVYQKPNSKEIMALTGAFTQVPYADGKAYARPEAIAVSEDDNGSPVQITGHQFAGATNKIFFTAPDVSGYFLSPTPISVGTTVKIGIQGPASVLYCHD